MNKRILIVDDEESVAFFLGEDLAKLGGGYRIETANSGTEALSKMAARAFDLVVTDLRMPGMDGLALMETVRGRYPRTRLILMTAFGDAKVEAMAYRLGACRYLGKPFRTETLLSAVRTALVDAEMPGRDILVLSDDQFDALARCLSDLRFEVGAQCILLADVAGQLVAHIGETDGLDLTALISLIGGSFATAFEMARYLGEGKALTLNYHEGERYDVYSSNVNRDLFVVLLFDKRQQRSRVGMVWLYTQRTLKQLQAVVDSAEKVNAGQVLDADFGAMLSDSMDQLFSGEDAGSAATRPASGRRADALAGWGDVETNDRDRGLTLEEATARLREASADRIASVDHSVSADDHVSAPPPTPAGDNEPESRTFTLQQALEMGLVDPAWVDDAAEAR